MGEQAICTCMDDPREYKKEYTIGEDDYNYKIIVCNIKYITYI